MLLAHYAHRLPADHDIAAIRTRAQKRGPEWDAMPDLHFKAFLLRERGRSGATANNYSSLYLWRTTAAFADFVGSDRFAAVTDSFGRPAIYTAVSLDARRGPGITAHAAMMEDVTLPLDIDIAAVCAAEVDRNRAAAAAPGVVVALVALDPTGWRLRRVVLTEDAPPPTSTGTAYEILYLAQPHLDELPLDGEAA